MNHNEASRLMASEKYLLDELSPAEMEAFEEHLFDCNECSLDVRAGSLFLEHGKVELANPTPKAIPTEGRPSRGFTWWPAFAVPAIARHEGGSGREQNTKDSTRGFAGQQYRPRLDAICH